MAYLGNRPAESFASFEKQVFTIVNSQTAYTLSHSVTNENDIRLVVNSVVQEPGSGKAYTASGTTLTLSAALVNGTDTMYCVFLGRALQTVNPPNASVGSAQIADSLISGKTALGATPADTDELLISDAGTLKRVDYSHLKSANTPIFEAAITSNQSVSDDTATKAQFASEIIDTDSAYDNSTNYRFTVPSGKAGTYYFFLKLQIDCEANSNLDTAKAFIYKNGSVFSSPTNFGQSEISFLSNPIRESEIVVSIMADLVAGDYIEAYGAMEATDSSGGHFGSYSVFKGYKLIT